MSCCQPRLDGRPRPAATLRDLSPTRDAPCRGESIDGAARRAPRVEEWSSGVTGVPLAVPRRAVLRDPVSSASLGSGPPIRASAGRRRARDLPASAARHVDDGTTVAERGGRPSHAASCASRPSSGSTALLSARITRSNRGQAGRAGVRLDRGASRACAASRRPRRRGRDRACRDRYRRRDVVAGSGERHADSALPAGTARGSGRRAGCREREVHVDVARIVGEIEVVVARQRAAGALRRGAPVGAQRPVPVAWSRPPPSTLSVAWRTARPSRFRTARALIASSTQRCAAGGRYRRRGRTAATPRRCPSPPARTRPTMRRIARSSSRVSMPPGSGVPVPGAMPGSITSMSIDR